MASPTLRICLPIIVISALAIGLNSFLNFGNFERSFNELERSRIDFLVNDLANNLETGLALGLPLRQLANAQAAIEFELRADAEIISISVFDEAGAAAFHAGQPLPLNQLPARWRLPDKAWQLIERDAQIIGVRLVTAIGADAGGLVLRYTRRHHDQVMQAMGRNLLQASIVTLLLTALATLLGIGRLLQRAP